MWLAQPAEREGDLNAGWALGLMTGTVLDGMIDIALLRTDGESVTEFGPWTLAAYPGETRSLLARTLDEARAWQFTGPEPTIFREAEAALTRGQSAAVTTFLTERDMAPSDIAAIGFHGQTVLHRAPQPGRPGDTRQLGDGALMARLTGIDVVYDFRTADVRAGGQGAPLSASYHAALLARMGLTETTAVLNLGGVANISWRGDDGLLCAFDTGPANAPVNDWVEQATGEPMDRDGALARQGTVDEPRLARLLQHPYLAKPFPKSLDRFDFPASMAEGLSLQDGAATLTAFTAAAVGCGLNLLPRRPVRLLVCGGGRKNPALMEALRRRAGVDLVMAEEAGLRGDAIEAECFAFLAMRTRRGLPISFPTTTGVDRPMPGGRIATSTKGTRLSERRICRCIVRGAGPRSSAGFWQGRGLRRRSPIWARTSSRSSTRSAATTAENGARPSSAATRAPWTNPPTPPISRRRTATNPPSRSISRPPRARRLVADLANTADILVENFRPGSLAKYGLDPATLMAANPRLIYCSITAFGQHGPYMNRPGYDFAMQARGGLMSITGQPDGTPGAEPMKVGVAVTDMFTGMYAAVGILAAVQARHRTGVGQHIDVALVRCAGRDAGEPGGKLPRGW